tara:strand:+ start:552 stop:824 length:273 start_codon:yes stop_codon:yes gene_type:complete
LQPGYVRWSGWFGALSCSLVQLQSRQRWATLQQLMHAVPRALPPPAMEDAAGDGRGWWRRRSKCCLAATLEFERCGVYQREAACRTGGKL